MLPLLLIFHFGVKFKKVRLTTYERVFELHTHSLCVKKTLGDKQNTPGSFHVNCARLGTRPPPIWLKIGIRGLYIIIRN